MKKFKVSRCEDSDYILDSKRRYGVEYISIDKDFADCSSLSDWWKYALKN